MKSKLLKSQAAKQTARSFYINCFTLAGFYTFFNSGNQFSAGNDMISGGSFTIPQGTNPTNGVNQVLNEMAMHNPFILEKIRIKHIYTSNVQNTSPINFNAQWGDAPTTGHAAVQQLDGIAVVDPENEQSLVYDYYANEVIDGTRVLQVVNGVVPVGYAGYTITFYIKAIHDVYNFVSPNFN